MNSQHHNTEQAAHDAEHRRQAKAPEQPRHETNKSDAHTKAEQASRSVMHPDSFDADWRYYFGALGG